MLAVVAAAAALVGAALEGSSALAVVAVGLALNAAYSPPPFRLSGRGALAAALLPAGYVAVPFLFGSLSVDPHLALRELAVLPGLWLVFTGRIVLKDLRDEAGDRAHGKRTFLVRHGRDATCTLASAAWVVGVVAVLLGVDGAGSLVLPVLVLLGCALHAIHALRGVGDEYEALVAAVAQTGRGIGTILLVHLTAAERGMAPTTSAAAVLGIATLFVVAHVARAAAQSSRSAARWSWCSSAVPSR